MSSEAEFSLSELLRPELAELHAYLPELGEYEVRLDANEAPDLLSPDARTRLTDATRNIAWQRYPDPTSSELRAALASYTGVTAEEVLVGVGSDEIISLLVTALSRPRDRSPSAVVMTTTPTFVMYRMSARVRGVRVLEVPLDADFDLATDSMRRGLEFSPPNLIFIASPNNPSGNLASRERLEALIESAPQSLVVVDEAYVDYADQNQLELYRRYPNVVLLKTLSKIGFAALRVGWLVGRADLVREIDKTRQPYNMNTLSQRLGSLAVGELRPEIQSTVRYVRAERERVSAELSGLPGVRVTPSQANFIWFRSERKAKEVFDGLGARGVLVRSFHTRGGRLESQLRVTIGTRAENDRFLTALRELL